MNLRRVHYNVGLSTTALQIYGIKLQISNIFIPKFICFAEHNKDPAEILNHAEVKFGVNKA